MKYIQEKFVRLYMTCISTELLGRARVQIDNEIKEDLCMPQPTNHSDHQHMADDNHASQYALPSAIMGICIIAVN